MKHLPSHTPLMILAISVTLLVATLYGYMQYQVNISVGKAILAREVAFKEHEYKDREKEIMDLYASTVVERSQLAGYFIPADKTVDFIEAVESIGPISGGTLVLSSIDADPLDISKPGTQGKVRAHVEGHGSWVAVSKILMFAERLPYKVRVNDIRLTREGGNDKGKNAKWTVSFDIESNIIVTLPKKT